MKDVKFSIIVPTTDRPETLIHTLKTICSIVGDDYEIILSDNKGPAENRRIFDSLTAGGNIEYFRHEVKLSMDEHYEFCLNCCSGEYLTIIGDDDGFTCKPLDYVREITKSNSPDVIFWWPYLYFWPNSLIENKRSLLFLDKPSKNANVVDPKFYVNNFYDNGRDYHLFERLPSIYNGFVKRTLIDKIRLRTKKYFNTPTCPDVYSGIINGIFAESAIFLDWPLTIRGLSGKSIGHSYLTNIIKDKPYCGEELVNSSALAMHLAAVKIIALKAFPELLADKHVNVADVINGILSEATNSFSNYDELTVDAKTLGEKYNIFIESPPPKPTLDDLPGMTWGWSSENRLLIKCDEIGITNIFDVSKLILSITGN